MAELIPDLIEVGVTILDPIQVTARGMEIESLAARFGDRLTFHGGVDIQELLPNGTEEDVRREVRRWAALFAGRGGYILRRAIPCKWIPRSASTWRCTRKPRAEVFGFPPRHSHNKKTRDMRPMTEMTSRERLLTALRCQEPDRVPIPGIHRG